MEFVLTPHALINPVTGQVIVIIGHDSYIAMRSRRDKKLNYKRVGISRRKMRVAEILGFDIARERGRYDVSSGFLLLGAFLEASHSYPSISSQIYSRPSGLSIPLYTLRFSWIDGLYKRVKLDIEGWMTVNGVEKI